MNKKIKEIKTAWRRIKTSSRFHNVLMFLIFVAVAALFWFIIALNDNVIETFRVKIEIQNVPDTVTFITDPPAELHVTVRDKGTNILRSGVIKNPVLGLNFRDYSRDGVFYLSKNDLSNELKSDLGGAAQIAATSIDSLRFYYTDQPGKRVPVVVNAEVTPASGYVILKKPTPLTYSVLVYSYHDEVDTVSFVSTQRLVRKDLSQTEDFEVKLQQLHNVKIVPDNVKVRVSVEPLVHKEIYVPVEVLNQPVNMSLLLFPNRVPVSFYVPMSRFNEDDFKVRVVADFNEIYRTPAQSISVSVKQHSAGLVNVELKADSVDYTLVKH